MNRGLYSRAVFERLSVYVACNICARDIMPDPTLTRNKTSKSPGEHMTIQKITWKFVRVTSILI